MPHTAVVSSRDELHSFFDLLQLVVVLKALIEVAGIALLGQGILFLFAGANRDKNFPYVILSTITKPVFVMVRFLTPRFVLDRFIWLAVPAVVAILWIVVTYFKITLVLKGGG